MKHVIFSLVVLILVGCAGKPSGLNVKELKIDIKNKDRITLKDYTDFVWDRFYAFPPYATLKKVAEESGFEGKTSIYWYDSITLLVFKNENQVVRHVEV